MRPNDSVTFGRDGQFLSGRCVKQGALDLRQKLRACCKAVSSRGGEKKMEDQPGIEPRAGRMLSGLTSLRHVPICLLIRIPISNPAISLMARICSQRAARYVAKLPGHEFRRGCHHIGTARSGVEKWTHWDLNPGPSACEADVIPLHHVPICIGSIMVSRQGISGPSDCTDRSLWLAAVAGQDSNKYESIRK
jgi:hypothetical protein